MFAALMYMPTKRKKTAKRGKKPVITVEEYFALMKPDAEETLRKLRADLLRLIPGGEEVISYQIPTIKYKGIPFIAYAGFAAHCGLYTMSHSVIRKLAIELKHYDTSGVTIRFPIGSKLPILLLRKIITARKQELMQRKIVHKLAGRKTA